MTAIGSEPCAGRVHQDDSGTAGATTTAALAGADRVSLSSSPWKGREPGLGSSPRGAGTRRAWVGALGPDSWATARCRGAEQGRQDVQGAPA